MERLTKWGASISETGRGNDWRLNAKMLDRYVMDMTPVCERCGKVAPVDEKLSTPNWTVYRTKEPCECGGKYTARAFLDDSVLSSCDKEANHA